MVGVSDELRDYRIDAYCIGNHVIKAQASRTSVSTSARCVFHNKL